MLTAQLARIREALDDHDFVFIDGTIDTVPAEGAPTVTDEFYGYFEKEVNVNNSQELVVNMIQFVESNGPFDAVMGFSEGGIIAAMLLIEDSRQSFAGFKCGIFFSAAPPLDPDVVRGGILRCVDPDNDGVLIQVPTAHIGGSNESLERLSHLSPLAPLWPKDSALLRDALVRLCDATNRQVFLHSRGHDIPGGNSLTELSGVLRVIERTIESARAYSA
ncbi:hypothetical protein N8I77_004702 [Diaporthe amygdali]|uniref:Serine hydrolase domain-containing protein n=1 Tax=Phomopsis amygdali TaxID=1214568 RepID=A0AAD9SLK1_PHOAM|nr:hypothetical protein N8I77_004702 [Diaporthe amygdali]